MAPGLDVRSEGFSSQARVEVRAGERTIQARLGVVAGSLLGADEAGFRKPRGLAWG